MRRAGLLVREHDLAIIVCRDRAAAVAGGIFAWIAYALALRRLAVPPRRGLVAKMR